MRPGQARALPRGLRLRFDVLDVFRGVPELLEVVSHGGTVQSHRPKIELIGHSRAGAFKPRLRVEPTINRDELLSPIREPGELSPIVN